MTDQQQLLTLIGIALTSGAAYVWPSGSLPDLRKWLVKSEPTAAEMLSEIKRLQKRISEIEASAASLALSKAEEVRRLKEVSA